MHFDTWEKELLGDEDRDFILHGIKYGFNIIDADNETSPVSVELNNYKSATCEQYKDKVEARIRAEILEGNYVIVSQKPIIVSALGAIPKDDNDVRLIHDCSRPRGSGLNDYATIDSPVSYQSVNDALSLIGRGWWQCKVDLRWAYRVCGINPAHWPYTGLKWRFQGEPKDTYMVDTRLSFGARKAPHIFHRLTQAVKRMLNRKGFKTVVVFLDDFYLAAPTREECLLAQSTLLSLLRNLGFHINWKKLIGPTKQLVFLGINICTDSGTLWLDEQKADKLKVLLSATLKRRRVPRKHLETLVGKLSWAAAVNPWGRLHLRMLYDAISATKDRSHKIKLEQLLPDLQWWQACLDLGNNKRLIWDDRPILHVFTDSSNHAGGAFCHGDWLYRVWHKDKPSISSQHINLKELAMVGEAIDHWARQFSNYRVHIYTDNMATSYMINKGTSRHPVAMETLRSVSYNSLKYDFAIEASYLPGRHNDVADAISRLHSPGQIQRFFSLLRELHYVIIGFWMQNHMSVNAMNFLSPQVQSWKRVLWNWTKRWQNGDQRPSQNLQNAHIHPS